MKYLVGLKFPRQPIKYFSIQDKKHKPRAIVFNSAEDANNYGAFCIASKCKFNTWPQLSEANRIEMCPKSSAHVPMGLTRDTQTRVGAVSVIPILNLHEEADFKCHLPNFVTSFVEVVEIDDVNMMTIFAKTGFDIYVSNSFYFKNDLSVCMDISENNFICVNTENFREYLEESF